jgi:hypothetical protein
LREEFVVGIHQLKKEVVVVVVSRKVIKARNEDVINKVKKSKSYEGIIETDLNEIRVGDEEEEKEYDYYRFQRLKELKYLNKRWRKKSKVTAKRT